MKNKSAVIVCVIGILIGIHLGLLGYSIFGEKPKERVETITKNICENEGTWKALKEVDDEGFLAAYQAFGVASQMMDAIARGDTDAFIFQSALFKENTKEIEEIGERRQLLLEQLGY